jgi:general secretion pathway protein A
LTLYLNHFGLQREPFSIVPDPSFLYPSPQYRQALAHLKYGLDREGGFILLTGEVGTGKTTLTRILLKSLPAHIRVAYVLNSKLESIDLLASICHELDIAISDQKGVSYSKIYTDAIYRDLLATHADGMRTLIVVEEAQNLNYGVLESLRLLSNLETETHKLLHILLVGQPELLPILAQTDLRQLNQRVVARFHLQPLSKTEIANYVNHRLNKAGAKQSIFNADCAGVLYRLTEGIPRLINLVCHQSLLAAYSNSRDNVCGTLVESAAGEILPNSNNRSLLGQKRWIAISTLFASLFVVFTASYFLAQKNGVLSYKNISLEPTDITDDEPVIEFSANPLDGDKSVSKKITSVVNHNLAWNLSPEKQLLELWVSEPMIRNEGKTYDKLIDSLGLKMKSIEALAFEDLLKIDRPGIVNLIEHPSEQAVLLTEINSTEILLATGHGSRALRYDEFLESWDGSYKFLWKPPPGYGVLKQGESNRALVEWLQSRLMLLDNNYEWVITGGHYTEAIGQKVLDFQERNQLLADGILGDQTTMMLNTLTDQSIPLLRRR